MEKQMNAPLFPVHTGVSAYEKVQAAQAWRPNVPAYDAADFDDRPTAYDELQLEKALVSEVLTALKSGRWDGVHITASSTSNRKPVVTTQELVDVVLEQLFNEEGARAHLIAWLMSDAGAAAALCIAHGHAGANASGLMEAHQLRGR